MKPVYPFRTVRWSLYGVPMTYYGPDLAEMMEDLDQAA